VPRLPKRIKRGRFHLDRQQTLGAQGAVNVPLSKLTRWLSRADKNMEIVAYCRGPYCILSFEAVAHLRGQGFKARRLEDGYPEWKAAGLPVQMS